MKTYDTIKNINFDFEINQYNDDKMELLQEIMDKLQCNFKFQMIYIAKDYELSFQFIKNNKIIYTIEYIGENLKEIYNCLLEVEKQINNISITK